MALTTLGFHVGGDICGRFFVNMVNAFSPDISHHARVLEVGCSEYDFLRRAQPHWPGMQFTGIDVRVRDNYPKLDRVTYIKGDVLTHDFQPGMFDWIIAISTMEHIGLGHYGDPKDQDGDIKAMRRIWDWMAPGAWMAFDVPWEAGMNGYRAVRTSHRIYDDDAIQSRLAAGLQWNQAWSGVARLKRPEELLAETPRIGRDDDFYVKGFWWQKPTEAA